MTTVVPPSDPLRRHPSSLNTDTNGFALPRLLRVSAIALAFIGVAAFSAIIYSAVKSDTPIQPSDVPLIEASNAPMREAPAEQGGMEVANRDSTVYNGIDTQAKSTQTIERLVPAAETPVVPAHDGLDPTAPKTTPAPLRPNGQPALTAEEIKQLNETRHAATATVKAPAQTAAQVTERVEPLKPAEPVASAPVATGTPDAATPAPLPEAKTVAEAPKPQPPKMAATDAVPATTAAPAPTSLTPKAAVAPTAKATAPKSDLEAAFGKEAAPAKTAPVTGSKKLIQLGALKSEADAQAEWKRLVARNGALLAGLSPSVQKADLGAKGIFYRLRGGPVSAEQGAALCVKLKAAGQSCMVVAP